MVLSELAFGSWFHADGDQFKLLGVKDGMFVCVSKTVHDLYISSSKGKPVKLEAGDKVKFPHNKEVSKL